MNPENDKPIAEPMDRPIPPETEEELTNHPDDELLTAWLDGELSAEEKAAVEKRLTEDAEFALRYQRLGFANRLVDSLAPAPVNERLNATTMELVSEAVRKELAEMEKKRFQKNLLFGISLFFAVVGAFALGVWGAVRWTARIPEEIPRSGNRTGQPNGPNSPMPPDWKNPNYRGPVPYRNRPRGFKQILPEELRNEKIGSIHRDLIQYVQKKYEGKLPEGPKEEILYQFISEQGIDSLIGRLSDSGKAYMAQQPDDQKIRLIGLLILSEIVSHRVQTAPGGLNEPHQPGLPPKEEPNEGPNNPPDMGPMPDNPVPPNRRNPPNDIPDDIPPGDVPPNDAPSNDIPSKDTPPDKIPPNGSPASGFYWKNESTGELAKTLQNLPPEIREKLLHLPDEEMYAQLLILHWGFFSQQPGSPSEGVPPFRRSAGTPYSERWRSRSFELWNRYLDEAQKEKTASPPEEQTPAAQEAKE